MLKHISFYVYGSNGSPYWFIILQGYNSREMVSNGYPTTIVLGHYGSQHIKKF